MRNTLWLVLLAMLAFPIYVLVILTQQGNFEALKLSGNILFNVLALCAVIGCWIVYRKVEKVFPDEKKGWFILTVALLLNLIGDILWAVYEVILGVEVPIGGWVDLFLTLGYFGLIVAVFFFLRTMFFSSQVYNYFIMTFSLIAGGALLYLGIAENLSAGAFSSTALIQNLYPFYDMILLGMITILLIPLVASHNRLFVAWLFIGGGIMSRIVYDVVFARLTSAGLFYTGHPIDVVYPLAYVFYVLAADTKFKLLEHDMHLKKRVNHA